VDGVVGPLTSAALRNQTATTATLQSFHDTLPGEAPSTNTQSTAAAELVMDASTDQASKNLGRGSRPVTR
jgi:hypothetical protein